MRIGSNHFSNRQYLFQTCKSTLILNSNNFFLAKRLKGLMKPDMF